MYCKECGSQNPSEASFCENCGSKLQNKTSKKWKIIALSSAAFLFFLVVLISSSSPKKDPVNIWTFIGQCEEYDYSDIVRQPNVYVDKKMMFTGKIVQVSNNTSLFGNYLYTSYRIDVTKDKHEDYEDIVYVTYKVPDDSVKFLEGDTVKFYGTFKGEKNYKSVLGATITVPEIEAVNIWLK